MGKYFVVITDSVPHCFHGGGGITAYAAVNAMAKAGYKVTVLALSHTLFTSGKTEQELIGVLQNRGIEVIIAPSECQRNIHVLNLKRMKFSWKRFFPGINSCDFVSKFLQKRKPDAVFMYHWNSIASTYGIKDYPKLGVVGDPVHLPYLFRKEFDSRYAKHNRFSLSVMKENLIEKYRLSLLMTGMREVLLDCDARGAFAAHHAKMLEEIGIKDCLYFRTPVMDPFEEISSIRKKTPVLKILHIGYLGGIATLSGIELLTTDIFPVLTKRLPENSFEIHIVGNGYENVPERLKKMLLQKNIIIKKGIYPPHEEFLSSHVVLVPTPIELGIRVRIITALSYASCVVAHRANHLGIPELEDGVNCLLGKTGKEIAEHCISLYHNNKRREEISINARGAFEKYFSIESAGRLIVERMEKLNG